MPSPSLESPNVEITAEPTDLEQQQQPSSPSPQTKETIDPYDYPQTKSKYRQMVVILRTINLIIIVELYKSINALILFHLKSFPLIYVVI